MIQTDLFGEAVEEPRKERSLPSKPAEQAKQPQPLEFPWPTRNRPFRWYKETPNHTTILHED